MELSGEKIIASIEKSDSRILPHAKPEHLQIFDLDDDGLGIHWPVIDEDLSNSGLLRSAAREDLVIRGI